MIFSLFYISDCTVVPMLADQVVEDIVAVSQCRNSDLSLTGALLFSGGHFAQLLEGGVDDVRLVMRSIERDPRHTSVTILRERHSSAAQFSSWSLSYSGQSDFVASKLRALRGPSDPESLDQAIDDVLAMMRQFVGE